MANLAIFGHKKRGEEVIKTLEMLGGVNRHNLDGNSDCWYILDDDKTIKWSELTFGEKGFTLEEFLKKFPYKIGNKVTLSDYESPLEIVGMKWEGNSIKYEVYTDDYGYWFSVDALQPYKEETMEEQKKDYDEWFQIDYLEFENNDDTWADEVEINLGKDYEIQIREDKTFIVKKKPKYPKTYEECCDILNIETNRIIDYDDCLGYRDITQYDTELLTQLRCLRKIRICRDAYWKLYGEQLGLGKPWEPDWTNDEQGRYMIMVYKNKLYKDISIVGTNFILVFPTEEMRDAFFENFKDLIEQCKELL